MKITLTIDVYGGTDTAREHKAAVRQAANAVLHDMLSHGAETVAEPIETSAGVQVAEITCQATYAEAMP